MSKKDYVFVPGIFQHKPSYKVITERLSNATDEEIRIADYNSEFHHFPEYKEKYLDRAKEWYLDVVGDKVDGVIALSFGVPLTIEIMSKLKMNQKPDAFAFLSGALTPRFAKDEVKSAKDRDIAEYNKLMIIQRDANFFGKFMLYPFAYSLLRKMAKDSKNDLSSITRPTIILQGKSDVLVDQSSADILYNGILLPETEKEVHLIENGPHHLVESSQGIEVSKKIGTFFDRHVSGKRL